MVHPASTVVVGIAALGTACGTSSSPHAHSSAAPATTAATSPANPPVAVASPSAQGKGEGVSGISTIVGSWTARGRKDTLTIKANGRFIDIDPQYENCDGSIVSYGTHYAFHANCASGPFTLILTLKPDGTLVGKDASGPLVYRKVR